MHRLLSLLIALAHLGAMAVPCVDEPTADAARSAAPAMDSMHAMPMTAAQGESPHATAGHAPCRPKLEMSAPCFCGCSQPSSSRGTVAPVAQILASRPADSLLVPTGALPVEERDAAPWPASPIDPPEHVPISS